MKIINTEIAAYPCKGNNPHVVLAVLTQDDAGLFAVYAGIVARDSLGENLETLSPQSIWVAYNGNKLSFERSKQFFNGIEQKNYRA
jgi:hypothetical protein